VPVKFHKNIFLNTIKKYNPDIILGIGQCARGNIIRIERKASNLKKTQYKLVNLKLKKNKYSRISYNAGSFVCNFSMYVILDYIKNKKIKFAFIHIPHNYDLSKSIKFIESKIYEARNSK